MHWLSPLNFKTKQFLEYRKKQMEEFHDLTNQKHLWPDDHTNTLGSIIPESSLCMYTRIKFVFYILQHNLFFTVLWQNIILW